MIQHLTFSIAESINHTNIFLMRNVWYLHDVLFIKYFDKVEGVKNIKLPAKNILKGHNGGIKFCYAVEYGINNYLHLRNEYPGKAG